MNASSLAPARHPLTLIAAVARNRVIGRAGRMPWHLPGDLAHFRNATMGAPLVMGRKTFDAIGRLLPGRDTIVVSADPAFAPAGVTVARTPASAIALADRSADALDAPEIMVAGGGMIYRALFPVADALLLTAVASEPYGDTLFPWIDPDDWILASRQTPKRMPGDSEAYAIEHWRRARPLRLGNIQE